MRFSLSSTSSLLKLPINLLPTVVRRGSRENGDRFSITEGDRGQLTVVCETKRNQISNAVLHE